MEYEMACRCGHPLIVKGTKLVCSANCGYEREFTIKPVLTQAQLLEENARLKKIIDEQNGIIERLGLEPACYE